MLVAYLVIKKLSAKFNPFFLYDKWKIKRLFRFIFSQEYFLNHLFVDICRGHKESLFYPALLLFPFVICKSDDTRAIFVVAVLLAKALSTRTGNHQSLLTRSYASQRLFHTCGNLQRIGLLLKLKSHNYSTLSLNLKVLL